MKTDQKYTEHVINAPVNSNHVTNEPGSAHATPIAEKYVKKRKEKANKQVIQEHKTDIIWSAMKYVIL